MYPEEKVKRLYRKRNQKNKINRHFTDKAQAIHIWKIKLFNLLESPLDSKEIKPVNPKGNYPWIFIGRTDAEAETLILWPPDVKSQVNGKDPDVGKDWGQEEKGTTEDEMAGWHHRRNGQEFEQTQGDSEGPGSLVCCSPSEQ